MSATCPRFLSINMTNKVQKVNEGTVEADTYDIAFTSMLNCVVVWNGNRQ